MSNELSEAEAQKLFNSVSANRDDPNKLAELLQVEPEAAPEAAAEPVEPAEVVPQETEAEASKEQEQPNEPSPVEPAPSEPAQQAGSSEEVEALKRQLKLMEHKLKSDEGRVSAFQRKANELEAKLAELSKTAKPPSAADATEDSDDPELKMLEKADPALYRLIMKREAKRKQELEALRTELKQELAPVRQTIEQREQDTEVDRLRTLIPNVGDVVRSEAFQIFKDSVATPGVRALLASKSADDVVQGMKLYADWVRSEGLVNSQPAEEPKSTPVAAPAAPTSAIKTERERKLATSVNVANPSAAPVTPAKTDQELFDSVFSEVVNRIQPKR